jgi:hypothetical protein
VGYPSPHPSLVSDPSLLRALERAVAPPAPPAPRAYVHSPRCPLPRTHSTYWHFSYEWRSSLHFHGMYIVSLRHLFSGMRRWLQ